MRFTYFVFLVIIGLGNTNFVLADQKSESLDEVNNAYELGVKGFKRHDYTAAEKYFEMVLRQDVNDYEALYNLAICYFKLEKFEKSNAAFKELVVLGMDSPKIIYSLAVSEKKLGNIGSAKAFFEEVALSTHDSLASLARKQLASLAVQEDAKANREQAIWWRNLTLGSGYDDSVLDQVGDQATEGDNFFDIMLSASWRSEPSKRYWLFNSLVYSTRYSDVDQFNILMASVGLGRGLTWHDGQLNFNWDYERSSLGSDDYLSSILVSARYKKSLANDLGIWSLKYRGKFSSSLNENFDHLAGTSDRIEIAYQFPTYQKSRMKLVYRLDMESRDDKAYFTPDGEDVTSYTNLSVHRHQAKLSWKYSFSDQIALDSRISLRLSDYLNDFMVNSVVESRSDLKQQASVSLSYSINRRLDAYFTMSHSNNDSSIDRYSYTQNAVTISSSLNF